MQKEKDGKIEKNTELTEDFYNQLVKMNQSKVDRRSTQLPIKKQVEHPFIISYYSVNRLRFDFLTCMLVVFDCFLVPIKNSFGLDYLDLQIQQRIHIFEYLITTIFFIDIILGFRKA